jgi:hypothetical protein
MVEYGLSRFRKPSIDDSRCAETDEPLAILGLVSFLRKEGFTLERHLVEPLNSPHASARGFAFEPFCAYLLACAFAIPRPLSEVFDFCGESSLGAEVAELIALQKVDNTFVYQRIDITSDVRPTHILGCSPSTNAETLAWLRDPEGTAFCFPAEHVGADLILILRLTKDSTMLRVCIQFKHYQELTSTGTRNAIRTTEPYNFLPKDSRLRADMITAIQKLGTGTAQAGDCGVLRVLISHPAPPNRAALVAASQERHRHPVATVDIGSLVEGGSQVGQMVLSLANQRVARSRKRGRDEDFDPASTPLHDDGTSHKKTRKARTRRGGESTLILIYAFPLF